MVADDESYILSLLNLIVTSGKSTTLYVALNYINTRDINIVTIENPVEHDVPSLNQVMVNDKMGRGFKEVLSSVLRQDSDVILVGEIRDSETARIAAQAALTGHLVLTTLHTSDAIQATTRLLDMGVERFIVAPSIIGVLGQRLVRKLCEHCKIEHLKLVVVCLNFVLKSKMNNVPQSTAISVVQSCRHERGKWP